MCFILGWIWVAQYNILLYSTQIYMHIIYSRPITPSITCIFRNELPRHTKNRDDAYISLHVVFTFTCIYICRQTSAVQLRPAHKARGSCSGVDAPRPNADQTRASAPKAKQLVCVAPNARLLCVMNGFFVHVF